MARGAKAKCEKKKDTKMGRRSRDGKIRERHMEEGGQQDKKRLLVSRNRSQFHGKMQHPGSTADQAWVSIQRKGALGATEGGIGYL